MNVGRSMVTALMRMREIRASEDQSLSYIIIPGGLAPNVWEQEKWSKKHGGFFHADARYGQWTQIYLER